VRGDDDRILFLMRHERRGKRGLAFTARGEVSALRHSYTFDKRESDGPVELRRAGHRVRSSRP